MITVLIALFLRYGKQKMLYKLLYRIIYVSQSYSMYTSSCNFLRSSKLNWEKSFNILKVYTFCMHVKISYNIKIRLLVNIQKN